MVGGFHGNTFYFETVLPGQHSNFRSVVVGHQNIPFCVSQKCKQLFVINFPVAIETTRGLGVRRINKKNYFFSSEEFFYQFEAVAPGKLKLTFQGRNLGDAFGQRTWIPTRMKSVSILAFAKETSAFSDNTS